MKKLISMVMTLAMILGVCSGMTVVAAGTIAKSEATPIPQVFEPDVTISLNIRQTDENPYAIQFYSPVYQNAAWDVRDSEITKHVLLRFPGDGTMQYRLGLTQWFESTDANVQEVAFSKDEWHNIKLKLKRGEANYWAQWYLDDELLTAFNTVNDVPISGYLLYTYGVTDGLDVDIVSVIGSNKGEMNAKISEVNYENKTITVDFSECPKDYDFTNNVVLKRTNVIEGESTVALNMLYQNGATVVFNYSEDIAPSEEYAIEFPDGVRGKFGSRLLKKLLHFNTANSHFWDFTGGQAGGLWLDPVPSSGTYCPWDSYEHGEVLNIRRIQGANAAVINCKGTVIAPNDGEISAISFDIKPMDKLAIELMGTGEPIAICLCDQYVYVTRAWSNKGWLNVSGYPFTANNTWVRRDGFVGKAGNNMWANIRVEFNKATNVASIFYNGIKVRELSSSTMAGYGKIDSVRVMQLATNNGDAGVAGATLAYLDNIHTETTTANVESIRFTDIADTELGAFDTLDKPLKKATVTFNRSINAATLENNITLYYNDEEVAFTGVYDESTLTYTLTPSVETPEGAKVSVLVNEVETTDGTTDGTSLCCASYVNSGKFSTETVSVVDETGASVNTLTPGGTYYLKVSAANYKTEAVPMQIIVGQYNEGRMTSVVVPNAFSITKESPIAIDQSSDNAISFTVDKDATDVQVFIWNSLKDMTSIKTAINKTVVPAE